jgi:hypothetical protein
MSPLREPALFALFRVASCDFVDRRALSKHAHNESLIVIHEITRNNTNRPKMASQI